MSSWIARRVPLLALMRSYPRQLLRGDVTAGLTTAVMLVPQAMAYASLAGMPPITGLYASVVPIVAYALLGTSGALAFGPVAIVALLTASAVGPLADGDPGTYVALAGALALMVGGIQLLLGLLRLGLVVDLLSHAVIRGFTSAAALVIAASQLPALLGIETERGERLIAQVADLVGAAGQAHPATMAVGLGGVAGLVLLRRLSPRFPAPLVVVVGATLVTALAGLERSGVAVLGEVPSGLPAPSLPGIGIEQLGALVVPAVTIALLSYLEGISVAKAVAARTRDRVDSSQELVASGAANLAAGVFQAFPVAGGFSRTAVNAQAGARTPLASLVTAATVAASALLLTPLFAHLPRAVLAAVVVVAVAGLVDVAAARHAWRTDRWDFAMLAVTFLATIGLGVEIGIAVGVGASVVLLAARTARPHVVELGFAPAVGRYRGVDRYETVTDPRALVVRVDAALLFATAPTVRRRLERLVAGRDERLRAVVLDASAIADVDGDGVGVLEELEADLAERGVSLHLVTVRGPVRDALQRAGCWQRRCRDGRVHEGLDPALEAVGVPLGRPVAPTPP